MRDPSSRKLRSDQSNQLRRERFGLESEVKLGFNNEYL